MKWLTLWSHRQLIFEDGRYRDSGPLTISLAPLPMLLMR